MVKTSLQTSPVKGVPIKAKILDFLAKPEPLEPAGSPTRAAVPPDLALNGITIEKDSGTEIVREEHTMELEGMEHGQNKGILVLEQDRHSEIGTENTLEPTPFSGKNQKQYNIKKEYCLSHGIELKKILVSGQQWKDRGSGRGFGFVTSKYLCYGKLVSRDQETLENHGTSTKLVV